MSLQSILELRTQAKELEDKAMELRASIDAMESKPEYKDGTPGYLWDDVEHKKHIVNLINTGDVDYPYTGTRLGDDFRYQNYENFTPLETAILGMKYRHEGLKYPGNECDELHVIYGNGSTNSGSTNKFPWNSTDVNWCVKYYYIIKRG